jgi:7-carboxy-7-deazaguanine synthase
MLSKAKDVLGDTSFRVALSECYLSLQGESSFTGYPTVFVRLYRCNLACSWCDSWYAVEGGEYEEVTTEELVTRIKGLLGDPAGGGEGVRHVCWTGGEPLLQARAVARAIGLLPDHILHTVETDGEVALEALDDLLPGERAAGRVRYIMDVKCPGSGMRARRAFDNLRRLKPEDELKFVILDRGDYEFAREVLRTHEIVPRNVLFSPANPAREVAKGLDPALLAQWILEDRMSVRLQLQAHKYIWPGRERGI